MKRVVFILLLFCVAFLAQCEDVLPQSINTIKQQCQNPFQSDYGYVKIVASGDIYIIPCPGRSIFPSGLTSPLTTKGDIWGYNTTNARIPVGTDGQALIANSANPLGVNWATLPYATSPLTTKGDLWGFSTTNARVPVGSNGQVLTADNTQALGVKWAAVSAGVTGTGTTDYFPKWTNGAGGVIGDSSPAFTQDTATGIFTWGGTTSVHQDFYMTLRNSTPAPSLGNFFVGRTGDYLRVVPNGASGGVYSIDIAGARGISLSAPNKLASLGDVFGASNSTLVSVDDAGKQIFLSATNGVVTGDFSTALGTTALPFKQLVISGGGAKSTTLTTAAASSDKTVTLPNATGNVLLNTLVNLDRTLTAGGTTGDQTINKTAGSVNVAGSAATLVVTNSLATTTSLIFAMALTNDATCSVKDVERASGSFTIRMTAACTGETAVGFWVTN